MRSTSISQRPGPTDMSERGHNLAKKNLLRLLCLALLARCATGTLLTTVCSHINRKKERRIHRLLLRQIQMNSDDKVRSWLWNPQIPEIKYNFNLQQKEEKVWQALVLNSQSNFVFCSGSMRQEFPDYLRLLAISREVLHHLMPMTILHDFLFFFS